MDRDQVISTIEKGRIIAIIRGDFRGHEEALAGVLFGAGITAIEVALNSPGALDSIRLLARRWGERMVVGAGTVLRMEEVQAVADAGGRFIVSPNRKIGVIERSCQLGLVSIPGCFTPSEVVEALDAGADAAKIFPASILGAGFIRAIFGPLPDIRLVPTGGVRPENAGEYVAAGAWAIATGSDLVGSRPPADGNWEKVRKRAEAYVAAAARGKTEPRP